MTGTKASAMPFAHQKREPSVHYLLQVISSVLEELVHAGEQQKARNDGSTNPNRQVSKFNGLHPPPISISYYLQRIAQFSGCSDECFVLMLIYIDRLVTKKNIALDAYNVHRLIISAILLSAKFFDDHFFFNPHFALVGGLQEHEMNTLELEFLFLIEFNLYVTAEDYQTYYNTLARMAHSRFMNDTLPSLPNIAHTEENLPKPLPEPTKTLSPPDGRVPSIPLKLLSENNRRLSNRANRRMPDKVGGGFNEHQQRTYVEGSNPSTGGYSDQQWVHVSPPDPLLQQNTYASQYHDFTIVNKSPEEIHAHKMAQRDQYPVQQMQYGVQSTYMQGNVNGFAHPYNPHHGVGMVTQPYIPQAPGFIGAHPTHDVVHYPYSEHDQSDTAKQGSHQQKRQ